MNGPKLLAGLLSIVFCTSLPLACYRSLASRARPLAVQRYEATDEVLRRAEAIARRTVGDPRTLLEHDSLLTLGPAYLDPRFGVAADYEVWS